MKRAVIFTLLAAALVLPSFAPTTQAAYVEENAWRFIELGNDHATFGADFHPNESEPRARALVVGGLGGPSVPERDRQHVAASYDGHSWRLILEETSKSKVGPYVDVEWHPEGYYALMLGAGGQYHGSVVACSNPCNSSAHLLELWRSDITPYAKSGFIGRDIAWHPSGNYTLLTGNALMRMSETWNFSHVSQGHDSFYSAADWHPDGGWALIQNNFNGLALCEDPCKTAPEGTDGSATSASPDFRVISGQVCYGQYPDAPDCLDTNNTYNGTKSIEDITYSPDGETIYVSGVIKQRGRIMEITHNGSTDPDDWTWRYLEPSGPGTDDPKYGEITALSFDPRHPERAIVGSSLSRQAMFYNTTTDGFRTLLDLSEPKMQDATWHTGGDYAIFPSAGGFFRYDPYGMPTVEITSPETSGAHAPGPIDLAGLAHPKEDGTDVTGLETRIGIRGAWQDIGEENWTRTDDGTVEWNATVDPLDAGPGHHRVNVRALDPITVGRAASIGVCVGLSDDDVDDSEQLPRLEMTDKDRGQDQVTFGWTDLRKLHGYHPRDVRYELERHPQGAPFETENFTVEEGSEITVDQAEERGEMVYSLVSYTCGQQLPATSSITVNMSEPMESSDDGSSSDDGASGDGDDGDGKYDPAEDTGYDPFEDPEDVDDGSSGDDASDDTVGGDDPAEAQGSGSGLDVPGPQLPLALAAAAVALLARRRRR